MNNQNPDIDAKNVVKIIKENLAALREDFDPSILTQEERDEIFKEIGELKAMALKLKADLAKG